MIRDRVDERLIAIEQQSRRIVKLTRAVHARSLLDLAATTELSRGHND